MEQYTGLIIFIIYSVGAILCFFISRKELTDYGALYCALLSWVGLFFLGTGYLIIWILLRKEKQKELKNKENEFK